MRCSIYEQALERQGVKWRYEESVPLEQIDAAKGLNNQARLEVPLDKELVEQYAGAMKGGANFPALVLWRPGRGRYIPVDGNQRLAAKTSLDHKTTDAYVIETEDRMVADRLSWSFNNLVNGKRLTGEECLAHAVTFVRKYGMSAVQAAKEWGIPGHRVREAVRVLELREKVEQHGVKIPHSMPDTNLLRLAALEVLGEDVMAKGVESAAKSGLSAEQCQELVNQVKAAKTQEDKLVAMHTYLHSPEVEIQRGQTKGGQTNPTELPRDKGARLVAQLCRLHEEFDPKVMRPVPHAKFKATRSQAEYLVNAFIMTFGLGAKLPREEATA